MADMFTTEIYAEYPRPPIMPMAIEGFKGSLLFTNFRGTNEVNYQLNYAFNGDLYYYVFGEKIGMAQIDGLAVPSTAQCPNSSLHSTAKDFVDYYKANKLGVAANPIKVTVGGMVMTGYFVSLNINLVGGRENTYVFSFSFLCRVN